MNRYIFALSLAVLLTVALGVVAQRSKKPLYTTPKLEDLPRQPLDTVTTADPETSIVIYTNNTWNYYRPSVARYNELAAFSQHWDTTQVFAYKDIALTDLPTVVELKLINTSFKNEFHYPIKGFVRSPYGSRKRRNHNGVDISLTMGEPIYASFGGKVRYSKYNYGGFGNLVIVRHENGLETWYAHLSKRNVAVDDYIKAGQVIGFGGSTGRSTGPHLHFEVRYCDQTFDPQFLIDFPSGTLRFQTFMLDKKFFNINSRASEMLEEDEDEVGDRTLFANNVTPDQVVENVKKINETTKTTTVKSTNTANVVYHTIISGDTLGKIAAKYKVSTKSICALNGITEKTTLRLGKKLRIK